MPEPAEIDAPRGDVQRLFDLDSKVIVVTGGTHGLGRAMVGAFAGCGAQVVVVSRNAESCVKVVAEVCDAGGRAVAKPCHVGRWAELEPLVDSVYDDFGRIDVLVNNAGSSPLYGRLTEITEDLWDKTIALNLKGPFRLCALVGERMTGGTGGSIINVSSVGAVRPTRDIIPYAAAKAGLNAMTVALADAFGPEGPRQRDHARAVSHSHLRSVGHGRAGGADPELPDAACGRAAGDRGCCPVPRKWRLELYDGHRAPRRRGRAVGAPDGR